MSTAQLFFLHLIMLIMTQVVMRIALDFSSFETWVMYGLFMIVALLMGVNESLRQMNQKDKKEDKK